MSPEFVVARAQAVARLAGIDGIGAEGEGGAQHHQRAGAGEFGVFMGSSYNGGSPEIIRAADAQGCGTLTMPEQMLINFRRRKRASPSCSRASRRKSTSGAPARAASSATSCGQDHCASCPACSRPSSTSASNATAFLHVADIAGSAPQRSRQRTDTADRTHPLRRPEPDGAGDQGPHRHQGCAAVDADLDRRSHAGLPQEKHIGVSPAHRGRGQSARALREADPPGAGR